MNSLERNINMYNPRTMEIFFSDSVASELGIPDGGLSMSRGDFIKMFSFPNSSSVYGFFNAFNPNEKLEIIESGFNASLKFGWISLGNNSLLKGFSLKVTTEKKQEAANTNSSIFNSSKIGRITVLFNGTIISCNGKAKNCFPDLSLIGSKVQDLVYSEYQIDLISGLEKIRDGYLTEVTGIVRSHGKSEWLECSAVLDEHLKSKYITVYFTEIDKWKRQQKILERKLRQRDGFITAMRGKINQLETISFSMSHDLRNPVANLKLILDILEDPNELENWEEWGSNISESVDKLEQDLNSYLNVLSSLKKLGVLENKDDLIDLNTTLFEVLKGFKQQLKQLGVQVAINLEESTQIVYNERLLRSILENLISNAIKYRDMQRPPIIEIGSYHDEGLVIYCKDNGIGMDLEKIGKSLFKPNKKFTDRENSTGIGLYLIKQQIEINGGEIGVKSMPGQGSEFIVKLKRKNREEALALEATIAKEMNLEPA